MRTVSLKGALLSALIITSLILSVSHVAHAQEPDIKAGDWIKYEYTISGAPPGTPWPTWNKVEFLSVEGTTANVRVTMHMSDGTEYSDTDVVDLDLGENGIFVGFVEIFIPADSKVGDSIYIDWYYTTLTIAGESTRTYAGASRTVVYAEYSRYGDQLTYYWDKQTGLMVEASGRLVEEEEDVEYDISVTAKATETNIWQAKPIGLPIDPILLALVAVIAVGVIAFMIVRRKRRPTTVWKF